MHKGLGKSLLLSLLFAMPLHVFANQGEADYDYRFSYSQLYSQLKYSQDADFPKLTMGLYFVAPTSGERCEIQDAWMEKEAHFERLSANADRSLALPIDSNLKKANPLVYIKLVQGDSCNISMVARAKENLNQVSLQQMKPIVNQMQGLYQKLVGSFGDAPNVIGLTFEFKQPLTQTIETTQGQRLTIDNGRLQVPLSSLAENEIVHLPSQSVRILPYIALSQ